MLKYATLAAGILAASPCLAAEVDFSAPILDLDGKQMKTCPDGNVNCKDPNIGVTLGMVTTNALLAVDDPRAPTSGEEKVVRFELAKKAHDGGKQNLSSEDLTLIKKMVATSFTALVVGRVSELLHEPTPAKK